MTMQADSSHERQEILNRIQQLRDTQKLTAKEASDLRLLVDVCIDLERESWQDPVQAVLASAVKFDYVTQETADRYVALLTTEV